jgi:hypothetical protein
VFPEAEGTAHDRAQRQDERGRDPTASVLLLLVHGAKRWTFNAYFVLKLAGLLSVCFHGLI